MIQTLFGPLSTNPEIFDTTKFGEFQYFQRTLFLTAFDKIPLLRSNWTVKTCEFTEICKLFENLAKCDMNRAPKILATSPDAMLIGQIYLKRTVNIPENVST